MPLTRPVVIFLLCCHYVSCKIRMCDLEDSACLTQGAKKTYLECVGGIAKSGSKSDPLYLDYIKVDQPKLKFTVSNGTLTGMKSCSPELVKLNAKDMTFDYHVACRLLTVVGSYEVKGELNCMPLEGSGTFRVDHYNYVLLFHGKYDHQFDKENKLHIVVKDYKFNTEVRGKVVYDYKNLYNGDAKKSAAMHKYANENSKAMDKIIVQPVMEKFMSVFMRNVNVYIKTVPVEHIFSYET